ncbi:MAG: NfeD family protein [Coleofasciculaceae cyanobacterium SM2_1_6]|nr:NfeD family protein [Coleofasciculaceae cyanobacterium SM2_1_6]
MNPTLLWLVAGVILCLMELFFPTAFVEFMMGLAALLVAVISLVIPAPGMQIFLWMLLATGLTIFSRRFAPSKRLSQRMDAVEGETITEIAPGKMGRVLYEGNSWRAKCADHNLVIPPHRRVYVVKMEGTTLIVLPENLLED